MQKPSWLLWAWREFGVREVAGRGDNPRISEMFKDAGHASITDDEVAWCAAFVGACLERSGEKSTRSLMARSYLRWGVEISDARPGAIAVLSRGSDAALGHVGFVVGESETHVFLLGGNQGNSVSVAAFPKSRLLSFRWSASESMGPEAAPAARPAVKSHEQSPQSPRQPEFESALCHVLQMEGGYSDDPHDPGGPTNKGITLDVYARWIGQRVDDTTRSRLVAQLKRIPDAMVREIYATRYWTPADCARMAPALALFHFDTAVNHGVAAAIRMLQQAVGADADGEIGPETRGRIAKTALADVLVAYAQIRRERYRSLKHFWRFGRGWLRRVDFALIRAGKNSAQPQNNGSKVRDAVSDQPLSDRNEQGETSMEVEQTITSVPAKWWGRSVTIWGVLVTAASTVLPVIGPLMGLDITGEVVRQIGEQLTEVVQAVGGVIGTLMAIYGRLRASQPIEQRAFAIRI